MNGDRSLLRLSLSLSLSLSRSLSLSERLSLCLRSLSRCLRSAGDRDLL